MLDNLVQILVAVGGFTGLAAPIVVLVQRRKINAEADKIVAETDKTDVDRVAVISDTALDLMAAAKKTADEALGKVDDLTAEVNALRRHVARLERMLNDAGIRPPAFTWPRAHRNGAR